MNGFLIASVLLVVLASTALVMWRPAGMGEGVADLSGRTASADSIPDLALLPAGPVRALSVTGEDDVWLRLGRADGRADRAAVIQADGTLRVFEGLTQTVEVRYAELVTMSSLLDFWAVDAEQRVWVGGLAFDGSRWHAVARGFHGPGGSLTFLDRCLIDRSGLVWVPYESVIWDCPGGGCNSVGIQAMEATGEVRQMLPLDLAPTAHGLPFVHLLLDGSGAGLAFGGRGMVILDEERAVPYPFLVEADTGAPVPGFITAAGVNARGQAEILSYTERDEALGSDVLRVPHVSAHEWDGATFHDRDLTDSPLFAERQSLVYATALAYAPNGDLWVASSKGDAAVRRNGKWAEHYTEHNSLLFHPIADMALDGADRLWVATDHGLLFFDDEKGWGGSGTIVIEATDAALSPGEIHCDAGAEVAVKLRNLGSDAAALEFSLSGGASARTGEARARHGADDWGGTAYVRFTAPALPGRYPFRLDRGLGQGADLQGVMIVVAEHGPVMLPSLYR